MKIKKHIPNILSSLRLLSPLALFPLTIVGNYAIGSVILAFSFLTDMIDGHLARKWNVVSNLGAKLDAIADKLMLISMLPLALINPSVTISLVFEGLISLVNAVRKLKGGNPKTAQIGRVKTVSLAFFQFLSYLSNVFMIPNLIYYSLFTVTTLLQTASLVKYISEGKKELKDYSNCKEEVDVFEEIELPKEEITKTLTIEIDNVLNNLESKKQELIDLKEELQRVISINLEENCIDKDNESNNGFLKQKKYNI